MSHRVRVKRKTKETAIEASLVLRGGGRYSIKTGISFLDHMLSLFAKHGLFDLKIKASGDLDVDIHHTNEDVAIVLGELFKKALGDKSGIKRFGEATVPMDEAMARAVVDISGRPFLQFQPAAATASADVERYHLGDGEHFLRAFAANCGVTLHIDILKSGDLHHVLEAVFKAFALALRRAVERETRSKGVPSTKGRL